jgi:hypothetical protein
VHAAPTGWDGPAGRPGRRASLRAGTRINWLQASDATTTGQAGRGQAMWPSSHSAASMQLLAFLKKKLVTLGKWTRGIIQWKCVETHLKNVHFDLLDKKDKTWQP